MKIRNTSAIRLETVAAFAPTSMFGSAGAPPAVAAADCGVLFADPFSLRTNANALHSSGSAAGEPELPRVPNQDDRLPLSPDTDPRGCAEVITGAAGIAAAAPVAMCEVVVGGAASIAFGSAAAVT